MRQITMISILNGMISASVSINGMATKIVIEDCIDWQPSERDEYIMKLASAKISEGGWSDKP